MPIRFVPIVVLSGGGTGVTANGTPSNISLSAPAGIALGGAAFSATPAAIDLSSPQGEVSTTTSVVANGVPAQVLLTAPTGTVVATGSVIATGAPSFIGMVAATGTAIGGAEADGIPAQIWVNAPLGEATGAAGGDAVASGTPAEITFTAPHGIAYGGAVVHSAPDDIWLTAPLGIISDGSIDLSVYPPASAVLTGIVYGPTGADYIGTLTIPSAVDIAAATIAAAQVTPIHSNVKYINDVELTGTGTSGDPMRPA